MFDNILIIVHNIDMGLITVQEAAVRLKVTVKALYYLLSEGKLTRHEQFGRTLVDEDEVTAYKPRGGGERPTRAAKKAESFTDPNKPTNPNNDVDSG
jgi:excisionase family DNA binding protein